MKHLFKEHALLNCEGSMTMETIKTLEKVNTVTYTGRRTGGAGERPKHVAYVWKGQWTEEVLKKDLVRMWKVIYAYFHQNFPHWEYMNALSALDLHASLNMDQRRELVDRLAAEKGINGTTLWCHGGDLVIL
jgi:hypothetical protein